MGAPELENCCGFSLKHGTIIIGIVQSIFAFMCLILSAAYSQHPEELIELNDSSVLPKLDILTGILTSIAVASALQCIFSILLIFGAASNRPELLTPWLILNPICLFVYLVATMVAIVHHKTDNNTPFIIGHILTSTVVILLVSYKILTVYSFKKYLNRLNF